MADTANVASLVEALTAARGHEARKPLRMALHEAAAEDSSTLAEHLDHADCFTRWEVVNLLGELADPAVSERVVEFALAEDEVHARWRSYWAVSRFPRERTAPLLLQALDESDEQRRWHAALILSMLGRNEAVPVLVAGLDGSDTWQQWEALSGLKALRPRDHATTVCRFLDAGCERTLRHEAVLALGAIGGDEARAALEQALDDPDEGVRWRASMGLTRINGHERIGA